MLLRNQKIDYFLLDGDVVTADGCAYQTTINTDLCMLGFFDLHFAGAIGGRCGD